MLGESMQENYVSKFEYELIIDRAGNIIKPVEGLFNNGKSTYNLFDLVLINEKERLNSYIISNTNHCEIFEVSDIFSNEFSHVKINRYLDQNDDIKLYLNFIKNDYNDNDYIKILDNIGNGIILINIEYENNDYNIVYKNEIADFVIKNKIEILYNSSNFLDFNLDKFIKDNINMENKVELPIIRIIDNLNNRLYYTCTFDKIDYNQLLIVFTDITKSHKDKLISIKKLEYEQLLNKISNYADLYTNENEFLVKLLTTLGETLNVDRTFLYELDSFNKEFILEAYWNNPNRLDLYQLDKSFGSNNYYNYREKLFNGEVLYCENTLDDELDAYHKHLNDLGITANINVPIFLGEKFHGFFGYDMLSRSKFDIDEDINLLKTIGAIISKSLQKLSVQRKLQESEFLFRSQFEHGHIGLGIEYFDSREIIQVNNKMLEILKMNIDEFKSYDWQAHTFEDDLSIELPLFEKLLKGIIDSYRIEKKILLKTGEIKFIDISLTVYSDELSGLKFLVTAIDDITSKREYIRKIEYMSFHDDLTGLNNRGSFEKKIQELEDKNVVPVSIILGDVNGLKLTNDIFGHHQGDKLLIEIAKVLKAVVKNNGFIYRWAGDEFVIVMPGYDEIQIDEVRKEILFRLSKYNIEDSELLMKPSISLGHATKSNEFEYLKDVFSTSEAIMYRRKLMTSQKNSPFTLAKLEKTLIEKSKETKNHTKRMAKMAKRVGYQLGLSHEEVKALEITSRVHDIGKIAIANEILNKPGSLTPDEWLEIKRHPEIGYRIAINSKELFPYAEYILSHHEKIDGTGYPNGLSKNQIPKISRILSVLDAYDAMTYDRVYRKALSIEKAKEELISNSGTQFDKKIVDKFIELLEKGILD